MPEADQEHMPKIVCITVGMFQENCYLYACPETLDAVSAVYPVPLAIHPDDVSMYTDESIARMFNRPAPLVKRKPDILFNEGDTISFGTLTLEVLHTPGHTRGGICLVSRPYCVFTGDTLFNRGIGRTD